jgi:hypothetical protein
MVLLVLPIVVVGVGVASSVQVLAQVAAALLLLRI